MIIEILLIVSLFLWLLALLPVPHQFTWSTPWLAWISVVLVALFLFVPGLR